MYHEGIVQAARYGSLHLINYHLARLHPLKIKQLHSKYEVLLRVFNNAGSINLCRVHATVGSGD